MLLVLLTITVGCGTAPGSETAPVEESSDPATEEAPRIAKTTVDALAVTDEASLPPCDRNGLLVYILDVKEFRVCDGKDWVAINIQGPKGDKGEDGVAQTVTTVAETPPASVWVDAMTGKWWLHSGDGPYVTASCTGAYRAATYAEIKAAVAHGLVAGFKAKGYATDAYWYTTWPDQPGPDMVLYNAPFNDPYAWTTAEVAALRTATRGKLCVK
jgi:hypothetical protein